MEKLLEGLQQDSNAQESEQSHFQYIAAAPRIGIGMDASVTPLRHGGLSLVQTTDFFYPLVDDPYMMVCGGRGKQQFIYDFKKSQFMNLN